MRQWFQPADIFLMRIFARFITSTGCGSASSVPRFSPYCDLAICRQHRIIFTAALYLDNDLVAWKRPRSPYALEPQDHSLPEKSTAKEESPLVLCAVLIIGVGGRPAFSGTKQDVAQGWPSVFTTKDCKRPAATSVTVPNSKISLGKVWHSRVTWPGSWPNLLLPQP